MSSYRGQFLWYDLMTEDPEAAKAFYTEAIGWGTTVWEQGESPYTMFTTSQGQLGGIGRLSDEAKKRGASPHWLGYVGVPDIDAAATKAAQLGATVHVPPTDIPTVGRFAHMADPQQAAFALFSPSEEPPATPDAPQIGEFSWHELATTDWQAAWSFYEALFGWKKTEAMDMGEAGTYQMFAAGERTLGGMFDKTSEMPGPPHWLYYASVTDIGATLGRIDRMGGKVLNGPMEVPGGDLIAQCLDREGAAFAVHMRAAQP